MVAISACNKVIADVANTLDNDEFFEDTVDTQKERVDQHRKQECLEGGISKDKAYLRGQKQKWT